jgi:hypothetical protein
VRNLMRELIPNVAQNVEVRPNGVRRQAKKPREVDLAENVPSGPLPPSSRFQDFGCECKNDSSAAEIDSSSHAAPTIAAPRSDWSFISSTSVIMRCNASGEFGPCLTI